MAGIGSIIGNVLSEAIKPVTGVFEKKIERRQARDSLRAKAQMQKTGDKTKITLSDSEWEAISASKQDTSWKDEWVTIIMTLPVPTIFLGSVYAAVYDDPRFSDGVIDGIHALNAVGVPMGELMTATVLAAVGLKLWRA